ncbi:hypothetical protein [Trichothermofontia sp.]
MLQVDAAIFKNNERITLFLSQRCDYQLSTSLSSRENDFYLDSFVVSLFKDSLRIYPTFLQLPLGPNDASLTVANGYLRACPDLFCVSLYQAIGHPVVALASLRLDSGPSVANLSGLSGLNSIR